MTKTQFKLDLAINLFGLEHPFTLAMSQKRDEEVVKEQYERLKEQGYLRKMKREYDKQTREIEIKDIIRRIENE